MTQNAPSDTLTRKVLGALKVKFASAVSKRLRAMSDAELEAAARRRAPVPAQQAGLKRDAPMVLFILAGTVLAGVCAVASGATAPLLAAGFAGAVLTVGALSVRDIFRDMSRNWGQIWGNACSSLLRVKTSVAAEQRRLSLQADNDRLTAAANAGLPLEQSITVRKSLRLAFAPPPPPRAEFSPFRKIFHPIP